MMIFIGALAWIVISQVLAGLICRGEEDTDIAQTIHAGLLVLPAMVVAMMLWAWMAWHLARFAHVMGWTGPASENPMDYL